MKASSVFALALPLVAACSSTGPSVATREAPKPASVEGTWPKLQGTLIVVNQQDFNVHLLDLASGATVKKIDTGKCPHEAAVSPNGKLVAVTNYGVAGEPGNSLTIIELPKAEVVKTVSLGEYTRPHGIDWLDNDRAIVTSETTKNLVLVDITKGQVMKALHTAMNGSHLLALTKSGKQVYSGNVGSGNVTGFDLDSGNKLWDITAGPGSEGVGVSPNGKQVWTGNRGDHTVSVIDTEKKERVKVLKCEGLPYRVTFTPNGKYSIVAAPVASAVVLFDTDKLEESNRIVLKDSGLKFPTPDPGPAGLAVHPNNRYLFTTVVNSASVAVIDLDEGKVVARADVGKSPDGIAISPIPVKE